MAGEASQLGSWNSASTSCTFCQPRLPISGQPHPAPRRAPAALNSSIARLSVSTDWICVGSSRESDTGVPASAKHPRQALIAAVIGVKFDRGGRIDRRGHEASHNHTSPSLSSSAYDLTNTTPTPRDPTASALRAHAGSGFRTTSTPCAFDRGAGAQASCLTTWATPSSLNTVRRILDDRSCLIGYYAHVIDAGFESQAGLATLGGPSLPPQEVGCSVSWLVSHRPVSMLNASAVHGVFARKPCN